MFDTIKQRLRDASTLKTLCFGAERHANASGQQEPGAEHFVLAALELPDGTARRVFERLQLDPSGFRTAIEQQYQNALRNVGIVVSTPAHNGESVASLPTARGMYKTQPSAQVLMNVLTRQLMVQEQKTDATAPLLGAHVVLAATAAQFGVATRAIQAMGVDVAQLAEAATAEINSRRKVRVQSAGTP